MQVAFTSRLTQCVRQPIVANMHCGLHMRSLAFNPATGAI